VELPEVNWLEIGRFFHPIFYLIFRIYIRNCADVSVEHILVVVVPNLHDFIAGAIASAAANDLKTARIQRILQNFVEF
jgi:hypothetical protein